MRYAIAAIVAMYFLITSASSAVSGQTNKIDLRDLTPAQEATLLKHVRGAFEAITDHVVSFKTSINETVIEHAPFVGSGTITQRFQISRSNIITVEFVPPAPYAGLPPEDRQFLYTLLQTPFPWEGGIARIVFTDSSPAYEKEEAQKRGIARMDLPEGHNVLILDPGYVEILTGPYV